MNWLFSWPESPVGQGFWRNDAPIWSNAAGYFVFRNCPWFFVTVVGLDLYVFSPGRDYPSKPDSFSGAEG